ncbi:hypothetical protein RHGRI_000183 [Rhododendron griersonianum]|uniref:DUF4220 domain-containing protein n=1 Tax=Rhododendron griersonianum TaxID=479676 RepID=A0AAV6LGQ8_9ERIC|nr:hypothetical protein RHGRI_000183 [Rhododendron griersonianum]
MIGQFDVLSYCLKAVQSPLRSLPPKRKSPIRKIIGSVLGHNYEEKWNRYLHKTEYVVRPPLYDAILQLRHDDEPQIDPRLISDSLTSELREIWAIVADRDARGNFVKQTTNLHLATEICYCLEMEWDACGQDDPYGSDSLLWKQNIEVSKALSDYMMYLIMMHPSLLPNVGSVRALERTLFDQLILAGNAADDVKATCRNLLSLNDVWSWIVESLKGKEKAKRWEIIKLMWLRTLKTATRGLKENTSDKENKSGTEDESVPPFAESKDVKLDLILADRKGKNQNDDIVQDEVPDEGWQEAFPKGPTLGKAQVRNVLMRSEDMIYVCNKKEYWVATVALGKLSDVLGDREKINVLWALWAPLLLLHLGGPDSITAYSLEDNQLWLRHLLGLVVQLSVAIYVILMSWKNLWFSFMSLPALVAGVIKYSERTLVLMSVSHEIYLHRRPFGSLRDKFPTRGRHDYVRVLVVAHEHLNYVMAHYSEREQLTEMVAPGRKRFHMEANLLWDAMGLINVLPFRKGIEWDGGMEDDPSESDSLSWKQNREVSKALSDYMMYLLTMHHLLLLLPNIGALLNFVEHKTLSSRKYHIRNAPDVGTACRLLLSSTDVSSAIARDLKEKEKPGRWEIIKLTWLRMLKDLTISVRENSSDKENKSGTENLSVPLFAESEDVKLDLILADRMAKNHNDDIVQDEVSDEGWQEAFPEGRSTTNRKSSSSMRPSLAKLSINFMHVSQSTKHRRKPNKAIV